MKVIIAGSRGLTDIALVESAVRMSCFEISAVLCGMAQGIDLLGKEWADARGITVLERPAEWRPSGKLDLDAGFKRNQTMADEADGLIAIWDGRSGGTKDMIKRAKKKGLAMCVIDLKIPQTTNSVLNLFD